MVLEMGIIKCFLMTPTEVISDFMKVDIMVGKEALLLFLF